MSPAICGATHDCEQCGLKRLRWNGCGRSPIGPVRSAGWPPGWRWISLARRSEILPRFFPEISGRRDCRRGANAKEAVAPRGPEVPSFSPPATASRVLFLIHASFDQARWSWSTFTLNPIGSFGPAPSSSGQIWLMGAAEAHRVATVAAGGPVQEGHLNPARSAGSGRCGGHHAARRADGRWPPTPSRFRGPVVAQGTCPTVLDRGDSHLARERWSCPLMADDLRPWSDKPEADCAELFRGWSSMPP